MKYFYPLFIFLLLQCKPEIETAPIQFPGKPEVPASLKEEHTVLLESLVSISLLNDSTGSKARKLHELLQHHFTEEEDYIIPPLSLLPQLASGTVPENSEKILLLTDRIQSQKSHISAEHQLIKAYLSELTEAAAKENHPEVMEFEKNLHKHAATEEQILFPSAILVGEFIKLRTAQVK